MADLAHNRKSHFMEPLSREIRLPEILLDRQSSEPLHEQITRQVGKAIRGGNLRRGCRLPSTRLLARMLGVSRNTVLIAYETLAAENLIRNLHGSGARVSNFAPVTLPPMASLLSAAMYPELVTLFADPDGNPFYLRHPDRR
jgi:DNA-binding transcriptional regulator YhcF (GntR family)